MIVKFALKYLGRKHILFGVKWAYDDDNGGGDDDVGVAVVVWS